MARYNTIAIGTYYLTSDGTLTGSPCRTRVSGLDALKLDYSGQTFIALDGTPYNQTLDLGKRGLPISIAVSQMDKTVFDSVVSAVNSALGNSSSITLRVEGDTGNFYYSVMPAFPRPIAFEGEFIEQRIRDVTFNFVTYSQGYLITAGAGALALTGQSATLTKA